MLCRVLPLKVDELIMSLYQCLSVISLLLHLRLWRGVKGNNNFNALCQTLAHLSQDLFTGPCSVVKLCYYS